MREERHGDPAKNHEGPNARRVIRRPRHDRAHQLLAPMVLTTRFLVSSDFFTTKPPPKSICEPASLKKENGTRGSVEQTITSEVSMTYRQGHHRRDSEPRTLKISTVLHARRQPFSLGGEYRRRCPN
jgi:hypothetical protein